MKKWIILLLLGQVSYLQAQSVQDSVDVRAFLDGVIKTAMDQKHIAGATLAVVKNGKVIMSKGYGYADLKKHKPVSPDSTLFRIGSISKMFTWVSVMQLVAQGKLDLNKDINQYLKDFKIPEKYGQPITLKHLMTHTPGFEDLVIGLFAKDSSRLRPLGEIFKDEIPDRVRPPYTQSSYSNHGTGMAAYIVEQVSGMSFHDYVEKNILIPLEMSHSTFRQPLPSKLKPLMSKGYRFGDGVYVEEGFEFVPLFPVGSASAAATDMTHFMNALLHHGTYKTVQLLDSATLALMQSPAHRHHPSVNPMRYGFMDMSRNGTTVIGHGGDTFWFHSLMALLPDHDMGIFLSFNSAEGGGVYMDVLKQFVDRYFPATLAPSTFHPGKKFLQKFSGEYRGNRYPYHDIATISSLGGRLRISIVDSTRIELGGGDEKKRFIPLDSTTFRDEMSSDIIAFDVDKKGKVKHLFIGGMPIFAFDKVIGIERFPVQLQLFVLIGIVSLVALLYWPLAYWLRRGYRSDGMKLSIPSSTKWLAWLNYFLLFVFLIGLSMGPEEIVYGMPTRVKVLLVVPFVMVVLTAITLFRGSRLLTDSRYRLSGRLYYLVLALTAVLVLWQLYYWNFIGFSF